MIEPKMELAKPKGYVIGAGFSKSISKHMPLTSELTTEVLSALNKEDPMSVKNFPVSNDVELLLTYLGESQPWLDAKVVLKNRALFLRISELIAEKIIHFQTLAIDEIKKAQDSWPIKFIQAWMNQPSCVVSLNYDVLIEQISTFAREGFDYRDLYTTVVASALSRKGTGMIGHYPQEQSLILYKLHGSINWRYSGSESFFGESIYDVGLIPFSSDTSQASQNRRSEIERSSNDKVPLIVPPTLHKETFFKNEFVKTQWRSSFENLSKCDEIFCLGYSLPKSDLMMRFYLSEVLKSPLVKKLFIVNRSADAISNYREAFKDFESKLDFSLVKEGEPIREIFKFSPVAEK